MPLCNWTMSNSHVQNFIGKTTTSKPITTQGSYFMYNIFTSTSVSDLFLRNNFYASVGGAPEASSCVFMSLVKYRLPNWIKIVGFTPSLAGTALEHSHL